MEKDREELELEELVFGDDHGFHDALKDADPSVSVPQVDGLDKSLHGPTEDVEEDDLENLHDADLFFLDSGPSAAQHQLQPIAKPEDDDTASSASEVAWVDSDDERLTVSLASNPRLRKLRDTEGEDLINGKEYTKRLRRQFERLYPPPEWANQASRKARGRRNGFDHASDSDDLSDDAMSTDEDDISAQPLAKLLRDPSALFPSSSTTKGAGRRLRPEAIEVHRLKDVGEAQPSTISSLQFHPQHPILLTSGPSGLLSLYHISSSSPSTPSSSAANPLITSLHVRHTPLTTSSFLPPQGRKLFFSGQRRYFHIWDLDSGRVAKVSRVQGYGQGEGREQKSMARFRLSPCGRFVGLVGTARKGGGFVNVVDAGTCQWVCEARVEGKGGVADFAWWGDGEGLVVVGKGGEVVEYEIASRRVVARWIDEGAVGITVVAVGGGRQRRGEGLGGNRWVAVGSTGGIVNLYDRAPWKDGGSVPSRPKPVKVFDQLVTPVSHLTFSPDGQVLCMSSRWKRDALRLVHLPSCVVYKNWPTSATPMGRISAVAWSVNTEMLAVGNEQGKVRLWEIRG